MSQPLDDDAVAAADKEMEMRANRAKELLSQRYKGLKSHQVRILPVALYAFLPTATYRNCRIIRTHITHKTFRKQNIIERCTWSAK